MQGYGSNPQLVGIGLLAARLVLGLMMAAHGSQKLFGWFGGQGLQATGELFGRLGFTPGSVFATAAAVGEVVSGVLVAIGFLGPVGPALMIATMIVAMSVLLPNGVFAAKNGIELPLLYGAGAFGLALVGPGLYSLDSIIPITGSWPPKVVWAVVAVGVIGGLANVMIRKPRQV